MSYFGYLEEARYRLDVLRAGVGLARLIKDPGETDVLFDMIALTERHADRYPHIVRSVLDAALADPSFREQCAERFVPPPPDLDVLREMPAGTLGRAFYEHMVKNGLDVDFYPDVPVTNDASYLSKRLLMVHDIWHVVTGFDTSVVGEAGLQAFTLAQVKGPLSATIAAGAIMHVAFYKPLEAERALAAVARGYTMGRAASNAVAYPFDSRWMTPLTDVRKELGITIEEDAA